MKKTMHFSTKLTGLVSQSSLASYLGRLSPSLGRIRKKLKPSSVSVQISLQVTVLASLKP